MSCYSERRVNFSLNFSGEASAPALTTALAGNVKESRAGTFEQINNGQFFALEGGAGSGAPLQSRAGSRDGGLPITSTFIIDIGPRHKADDLAVPADAVLAADASPPSSICANAPAGATSKGLLATMAARETLVFPSPKGRFQKLIGIRSIVASQSARVSINSPALAGATFLDELLAVLKWAVGDATLALQSMLSGGWSNGVLLALSWGGIRDGPAGIEATSVASGMTQAKSSLCGERGT